MNYLGLNKKSVFEVVERLNDLLADYHIYYQNLRNFHWNVEGENFYDLHETFEQLYNDARLKIDEVAERILTLRQTPMSRLSDYLDRGEISEAADDLDDRQMVTEVLKNHRTLIQHMRKILDVAANAKDEGTIDLIGGFLSELEKTSWMLDAWHTRKFVSA